MRKSTDRHGSLGRSRRSSQRRHFAHSLLVLAALVALFAAPVEAQFSRPLVEQALTGLEEEVGSPVRATVSAKTGLVTFLSFASHQQSLGRLPAEAPAEDRARAFLDGYGRAFGVSDRESLALTRIDERDEVGMEHVRFRQMHRGIPVTGGEMTVHLRGSNVVAVNAKTVADFGAVVTSPAVTPEEATVLAADIVARELGVIDAELSAPRLELLNRRHLGGRGFMTSLAWFVEARRIDLREFIWIDAIGGRELLRFSQLTDALDREVHDANDPTDGVYNSLAPNLVRDEGDPATGDTDVDTAYDYAGDTYDHFFNEHGRDSYDDAGATLKSWVHFCPSAASCPYQNAFWNGVQMVYGEGFSAADDVVAHELTHAVTEKASNLFYYMQSGALNESFSDIFGEIVDQLNSGGTDAPDNPRTAGNCSTFFPGGADNSYRWLMGEDVPGIGAIRDMWNPTCFGDPGRVGDPQFVCADPGGDAGGVHSNSGVPNHAFALMVDGGNYNSITVSPALGLTKAAKIQYRALANYLLSASDFHDNYDALQQACQDLIGTAGITGTDCTEVKDALDAVEMDSTWPCTPTQAAVPEFCPMGQAPEIVYFSDLESVAYATCESAPFAPAWCLNGPMSPLGAYSTSGTKSFWGYDPPGQLPGPTGGSMTVQETTQVLLPAGAKMQFNHSYGFDNSGTSHWDGGQIRYSIDNGATTPWPDAGGLIAFGQGYGGTVSNCCGNPLGGQSAFVRDTYGYTATQLDLSSLAGQNFLYQFYLGYDNFTNSDDYGWFVDDLRIYSCATCPTTRMLDVAYSGTADIFQASVSITAGSGFEVGALDDVNLEAPSVRFENGFAAAGHLTVADTACTP